jgi:hypothetical protein
MLLKVEAERQASLHALLNSSDQLGWRIIWRVERVQLRQDHVCELSAEARLACARGALGREGGDTAHAGQWGEPLLPVDNDVLRELHRLLFPAHQGERQAQRLRRW